MAEAKARRRGTNGQVDPTENVKALTDAAVQRIDDMADLQAKITDEKIKRMEREQVHLRDIVTLEAKHTTELRVAESARLDSIRQVDREVGDKTASQVLSAVQTLAATAATTAETLRNQVATTNAAAEGRLSAITGEFNKRLAELERTGSEGRGKQAMADPQMERLSMMVEQLTRTQAQGAGERRGMSDSMKLLMFALAVMTALMGAYTFTQRGSSAPPIYTPAPSGTQLPSNPPATIPR